MACFIAPHVHQHQTFPKGKQNSPQQVKNQHRSCYSSLGSPDLGPVSMSSYSCLKKYENRHHVKTLSETQETNVPPKWKSHLIPKSYFHSFHKDCHINQANERKPSFRGHSTGTGFSLQIRLVTQKHILKKQPQHGKTIY